jgi:hypothetical protein
MTWHPCSSMSASAFFSAASLPSLVGLTPLRSRHIVSPVVPSGRAAAIHFSLRPIYHPEWQVEQVYAPEGGGAPRLARISSVRRTTPHPGEVKQWVLRSAARMLHAYETRLRL